MLRNRAGGLYCRCKGFETKLKKEVLIEADSPPKKLSRTKFRVRI